MLDRWISGHAKLPQSCFHGGDEPAGHRPGPGRDIPWNPRSCFTTRTPCCLVLP